MMKISILMMRIYNPGPLFFKPCLALLLGMKILGPPIWLKLGVSITLGCKKRRGMLTNLINLNLPLLSDSP